MKALVIAAVNVRRMLRDRSSIFFVFVFPLLLILGSGIAFDGDFLPKVGVVHGDGPLTGRLVRTLQAQERLVVERVGSVDELRDKVEHGTLSAGLIIPGDYDTVVPSGGTAVVRYVARPDQLAQEVGVTIRSAVGQQAGLLRAARFATQEGKGPYERALGTADVAAALIPGLKVETTTVGEALYPATMSTFDVSAGNQLLLFIFLTSLTAATALIETRNLGLSRRMLATPTGAGTILIGEALGRLAVALVQGLFIMIGSALLFGVNWGNLAGAAALLLMFSLVGAGAAMLLGAVMRTAEQAISVGLLFGLGMAAIGGTMLPLELFSTTMRTVAHITPHAWAHDGFATLVRQGTGITGILPQLGVLAIYAVVLFTLGTWAFRRALTR